MFDVFKSVSLGNSLVALIPGIVILFVVYKQDKKEQESKLLLAFLLFLGMLSAFLTNKIGSPIATALAEIFKQNNIVFIFINCFFIIALIEEGLKYLSIKLPTWNSSEFDCRFDGVVYGVCVGLGFALYEAFFFGGSGAMSFMMIRSASSLSGHVSYGVIMGLMLGYAKAQDNKNNEKLCRRFKRLAFLTPWFLHGTYDFTAELVSYGVVSSKVVLVWNIAVLVVAIILLKISSVKDVEI